MSDYTNTAAMQLIHYAKDFENYFSQKTGKKFKLQKPLLKESDTKLSAKFVTRKSKDMGWLSYWPMFILKLDYDIGHDEYRVVTEFWDDLTRGKPAFAWDSRSPMPFENVFDPMMVFGRIIDGVAKRLKGGPKGDMSISNSRAVRQPAVKGGKAYEIRMPMQLRGKMTYAVYTGKEDLNLTSGDEQSGVTRKFVLSGKGGGVYVFRIHNNQKYMLTKVSGSGGNRSWSVIAQGTMSDNPVPEIIAR